MQACLSGLAAETNLPTNFGVRITRRGANAGEATVTKVVPRTPNCVHWASYQPEVMHVF